MSICTSLMDESGRHASLKMLRVNVLASSQTTILLFLHHTNLNEVKNLKKHPSRVNFTQEYLAV